MPVNPARVITEIERLKALEKRKEKPINKTEVELKELIKKEKMEEENEDNDEEDESDSDNQVLELNNVRKMTNSQESPNRKQKRKRTPDNSQSDSTSQSPIRTTAPNKIRRINTQLIKQNKSKPGNENLRQLVDSPADETPKSPQSNTESKFKKTHSNNDSDNNKDENITNSTTTNNNDNALIIVESEPKKPKRRRKSRLSQSHDEIIENHEIEQQQQQQQQRPTYLLVPIQSSPLLTCTVFNDTDNNNNILYTITAQTDLNNNTKTRLYKNNIEELSFIPNQVMCMVANKNYICLCDNFNTLYILNSNNGIHLGSYILPAPLHLFTLNSNCILFCLTMNGNCLLYDLSDFHLICESDILSIIQSMCESFPSPTDINILRTFLTNTGIPVITIKIVNNIRCFAFNINMKLWTPMDSCGYLLSEYYSTYSYSTSSSTTNSNNNNNDNTTTTIISQHQSTSLPLNEIQLPLREFQNSNNNIGRILYNAGNSDIQQSTRIHIENQIGSSIVLNSKEDFKYWMIKYVDFLTKNSDEQRIIVLCNSFLGKSNSIYYYKSLNINTKDFLFNEVLPILSTNISLQRIVSQFMDEYNNLMSQNKKSVDSNGVYKPYYY